MGITVLGPLTVDGSGRLGPRDRVVLQALATTQGQPVSADELIDALWGDHPPASAAKNLQSCVVRLRKALGPEAIVTSDHSYALLVPADSVDARVFETQVTRARELLALGEADRVAFMLEHALALWRGPAFSDLPDWPPARREARRLEELRLEAEEMYVDALMRSGRPREVLARGHAMVRAAPLRERRWELLALAQYQSGAQGEALRTIRQLRAVLAHELGIDPAPEMAALERSILRQDAGLLVPQTLVASASCPWQGLKAYDVDDADRFFGRGADVASCLDLLARTSFVALVGPSGSGKSSILRAGLLATLRRRGRRVVVITPGRRPMQSLTALPGDASADTVLAVDQAEEVFALCEDLDERRAFLERLAREAAHRPVLVAVRGDRLTQVTEHPGFSRLVENGMHLVGALDEDGLQDAVEGPARQAGLIIEPGLVDLLVGEVRDDPGALPLLSHALVETWQRREGNTLTVDGYHASGGIRGAVAQSAEHLYARVHPDQRSLLRDLVLRLVSPGIDGEAMRTRVPRRLIASDVDHEQLIELLVGARLVTSDEGFLEITHEALARAWPRLRGWLDDDVEGQRTRHHLSGAADAWDTLARPDSELYRGVRLTRALDWQSRTRSALTDTEREFLTAGRAANEAEEQSAAERARAQSRLIRRLRVVLSGAVVLLVLALAAGGVAVVQSDRASENAARAVANETAAEARRVSAHALATDDVDESMLLAVAGVRLDDSPETRSNLEAAIGRHPELTASTQMTGRAPVIHLDVSPDGRSVATYDFANQVRLYEIGTGELLAEYSTGTGRGRSWVSGQVAFSADGDTLAVLGAAPTRQPVRLLDAATLEPLAAQPLGPKNWRWQGVDLAFSQGGSRLAAVLHRVEGAGNTTRRTSVWATTWDLAAPQAPTNHLRLAGDPELAGVVLSPDGRFMVTSLPLTIHDLAARTSREAPGHEQHERLAMSPDGRLVAATDGAAGLVLLDATTGEFVRRLPGNDRSTWFIEFSSDGSRVATVTYENQEALVWSVESGEQLTRIPLGESGESLDFSPDGSTLYTAGSGRSLRHWDIDGDRRFLSRVAASKPGPSGLLFYSNPHPAPGGETVALPSDRKVLFFDVASGTSGSSLDRGDGYARIYGSWHPDGIHYALATGGEVRIWDAQKSELVERARPSSRYVSGVDYSTDGARLVIAELSGRVTMLDPATLTPVGRTVRLGQPVGGVAAGPDNRTAIVLTGRLDASGFFVPSTAGWTLVDLVSGTVLDEGELGIDGKAVDYSPDGRHAAVGGAGGEVLVLDLGAGAPLGPPAVIANELVDSVTYSPDGARILASGAAASVALLDGETGRLLARVLTPQPATTAGFREDPDSVLIATESDGPVYVWDTDVERAVDFACLVAGRGFTEAEWSAQFGDRPYQETCPGG
ncbi:MAG: winged helix-turn-helix domain-containing protein [Nocardioides sp.]|nr:winged helix-turn-helix domain-containing protein [Nocardioides sp.]